MSPISRPVRARARRQVAAGQSPLNALPGEAEVRQARLAVARHRRRRFPDQLACGFCGARWRAGTTYTGKRVSGCFRRRHAIDLLDAAGWLASDGRLMPPDGEARGERDA